MKKNAVLQVNLSDHAHIRYCQRVKMITWDELNDLCQRCFIEKEYITRRKRYVYLDGTWWAYQFNKGALILTTCYGKSDFDVPAGLAWAAIHHDSIQLSTGDFDARKIAETM